ncbi:MAG: hypothetical protein RLZZ550_1885 [Verrucomicrobiota bacterium]
MNKTTVFLTLLLGIGLGLLGARFFADAPVTAGGYEDPATKVEPAPAPVAKVKAPKPVAEAPKPVAKTDDEAARQEAKAKAKAFMEETKKMAEEIAGGDQGKLQRAVMSGMMKPENQALMKEMRELGAAMRNATPEEREVLGQQAVALRDRAMAALRAEVAALPEPGAAPAVAPVAPAAGGEAAPAAPAPAPVIIM